MNKEQILELIRSQEENLYQAASNAKLVFGDGSQAHKLACARWNTMYELLRTIENENN